MAALFVLLAAPIAAAKSPAGEVPVKLDDGWSVATPASAGLNPASLNGLPGAIARGDFPKTTSVLIVRDEKLVYERYFGDGGRDVLNDTRSATKSITSLAVGMAINSGAIASPKAPALAWLGDKRPFANDTPAKDAITIEDLLTMSSALDCNDDDDNSPGNEDKMHPQHEWTRWAVDLPTVKGYERDQAGLGPWRYCTTGAFLLGQIVQRAVREPVDRYIDRRLLAPLGITKREWPHSPSGEAMTGGGLRLRSRDLAKIAWMLADDGRWKARRVVQKSWIDAALAIHRKAYADTNYGYLFWQRNYATACGQISGWYMAGNGGNAIVVLRDIKTAVIVTRSNYNTRGMHQQTIALLEKYVLPSLPCARPSTAGDARPQ
jgi:CubicO group peptidase (beta-lactamase class C family)